jgi:TatD DNase family protein
MTQWADNHCHLPPGTAAAAVIATAREAGVERIVNVGTDLERSIEAIATAAAHEGVFATVGVHPHEASSTIEGIEELIGAPEVVAIGECGLDYHYDHAPRAAQREVFASQVRLARDRGMSLVVHTREAWEDTFAILDGEGMPDRVVFHCFTGGADEARRALDRGAFLSFSGIVTFKNAQDVRDAAALCPLDRLLVETDAPYLAPVPHRGAQNQPAWVPLIGAEIARVKGLGVEQVAAATWRTTSSFYGLSTP